MANKLTEEGARYLWVVVTHEHLFDRISDREAIGGLIAFWESVFNVENRDGDTIEGTMYPYRRLLAIEMLRRAGNV
jgi:hypothetical protein